MSNANDELLKSLKTGFLDYSFISQKEYQPELLLNNKLLGQDVLTHIKNDLQRCDEFSFAVAFITKSGIAALINTFQELEEKGIKGRILVSQYLNFTQPEALKALLKFKNIESKIVTNRNFHSKSYIFKKKSELNLIIGSSNLTADALCSNTELNIKLIANHDSKIAKEITNQFEYEFKNSELIDNDFIQQYEKIFIEKKFQKSQRIKITPDNSPEFKPNSMQSKAMENLELQRKMMLKNHC